MAVRGVGAVELGCGSESQPSRRQVFPETQQGQDEQESCGEEPQLGTLPADSAIFTHSCFSLHYTCENGGDGNTTVSGTNDPGRLYVGQYSAAGLVCKPIIYT